MPGLVPGIHAFFKSIDGRDKPGHVTFTDIF
jgi:hypothetical protein